MASLMDSRCQYLLLPRPWLQKDLPTNRPKNQMSLKSPLYMRGEVMVGGRTIRLPYWHKVVWIGQVES
jgi:hypothetical protein